MGEKGKKELPDISGKLTADRIEDYMFPSPEERVVIKLSLEGITESKDTIEVLLPKDAVYKGNYWDGLIFYFFFEAWAHAPMQEIRIKRVEKMPSVLQIPYSGGAFVCAVPLQSIPGGRSIHYFFAEEVK